ncbi:MAG: hypothetical protein ACLFNU_10770 [Bacteroidales bacterium]
MSNIRRISAAYLPVFLECNLGKFYQAISWQEFVRSFGIRRSAQGHASIFGSKGI